MNWSELSKIAIEKAKEQDTPLNDGGVFESVVDSYRYSWGPINGEIEWEGIETVVDELMMSISIADQEMIEDEGHSSI